MPKAQAIQLNIAKPCHQSWNAMTPSQDGRFCNECSKTVIDFSGWSDAGLYQFFAKNKANVCGRFLSTQLDVPIQIPHQPHSRLCRITMALGLTLICTQTPALLAQNRPPKVAQGSVVNVAQVPESNDAGSGSIYGQVLDNKKEALMNVFVQIYRAGELVNGGVTDYDGCYTIKPLKPGYYDLHIMFTGSDSLIVREVKVTAGNITQLKTFTEKPAGKGFVMGFADPGVRGKVKDRHAKPKAEIYGKITDARYKPLAGITVQLFQDKILKYDLITDSSGNYNARLYETGKYDIEVHCPNHGVLGLEDVLVKRGQKVMRDFPLPDVLMH